MAAEANKQPNIFVRAGKRIARWFREMRSELKKVVWPTKEQTRNNTVVVIAVVIIAAIFMIAVDAIFGGIIGLLVG